MIIRLSHIGHVVKSIDEVSRVYADLWGLVAGPRLSLLQEGIKAALFPIGQNYIELLEPTRAENPMGKALSSRGEGIYHLSWVVDDLEREIASLRAKGAQVAEAPPSAGLPFKTGWIHPRSTRGLLIELVEEELMSWLGQQAAPAPPHKSMVIKFSHVHHAVRSLDQALELYDRLWGIKLLKRLRVPQEGVSNAIVAIGDNYIELVEPTDPQGLVARFIERRGEGLRSLSLTVEDLEAASQSLEGQGLELVKWKPTPATPFPCAWLSPRFTRGLIIELCPHRELMKFMKSA